MSIAAFEVQNVMPLEDNDYYDTVLRLINCARYRIWGHVFLSDVRLYHDPELRARAIYKALAYALWRGVDVRLVIGQSKVPDIFVANLTASFYADELRIPIRLFNQKNTHSKYILFDSNQSIIGSHNWTDRGLFSSIESSVLITSAEIASSLELDFNKSWIESGELPHD